MIKKDTIFKYVCLSSAAVVMLVLLAFVVQLSVESFPAWQKFGFGFIVGSEWDPSGEVFGALPSIVGTLWTSLIALALALPLAFAAAIYLLDARPLPGAILSQAVDLLAAIPSVIYGMWGLFVLSPLMQEYVQPFLIEVLHIDVLPLFKDDYNGFGILTAGLILGMMILPYICAVVRDVFKMTPQVLLESAYGAGCTKLEVIRDIVLRYGVRGILGGIFIGLGRALGETMAVLFVIGNMMELPDSFFAGGTTIAATLANNFAEADDLQRSALFALGLILLGMSLAIQVLAQYYLHLTGKKRGER